MWRPENNYSWETNHSCPHLWVDSRPCSQLITLIKLFSCKDIYIYICIYIYIYIYIHTHTHTHMYNNYSLLILNLRWVQPDFKHVLIKNNSQQNPKPLDFLPKTLIQMDWYTENNIKVSGYYDVSVTDARPVRTMFRSSMIHFNK